MPVYHQIDNPQYQLALWRIQEDLPYFESHFSQAPDIRNAPQKLQWYALRGVELQIAQISLHFCGWQHQRGVVHIRHARPTVGGIERDEFSDWDFSQSRGNCHIHRAITFDQTEVG